jgi:acetoin utilization deacetylase AcuC-like enzyme
LRLDPDTYTVPETLELAYQAAGGAVAIASAVWQMNARRGFALSRPPGHHATPGRGMGFCLMNNIALAAEYLISEMGANRVSIIDLDLHHGNGTQDVFWQRAEVQFISVHQSPFYPGTGWMEEQGAGPGAGTTINIPFPSGSGDAAYQAALDKIILPALARYHPDMLLVSYGFDPHWRDPLGSLLLSAGKVYDLLAGLASWADQNCQGRLAVILEGGYDLAAAGACSQAVAAALLGQSWQDPLGHSPTPERMVWQPVIEKAVRLFN